MLNAYYLKLLCEIVLFKYNIEKEKFTFFKAKKSKSKISPGEYLLLIFN